MESSFATADRTAIKGNIIDYNKHAKKQKKHTKTLNSSKIAMLTKNEIDTVVPEEGMLVYNKTDKNVYVYADGSWKNLVGLLGTIGRIL